MAYSACLRGFSLMLAACLGAGVWAGDTYTWTGLSANNSNGVGRWTDPANWTVGGAVAATPPGCCTVNDGSVTNGVVDDIAVFGPVTAGAATTIDLEGLACIGGVQVAGAAAPAYTFGTSDEQELRLDSQFRKLGDWSVNNPRANFFVAADVTQSPTVRARCAVGYLMAHAATTTFAYGGFVNHAAVPLEVNNFGYALSVDTSLDKVPYVQFLFAGRGKINVNGVFSTTTTCYPTHHDNSDVTYKKSFTASRIFTDGSSGPGSQRLIEIPSGVEITHSSYNFSSIHCGYAVRIYGGGTLVLRSNTYLEESASQNDYRQIDCHVRVTGSAVAADGRVLMAYATGDYYYNCPSNDIPAGKYLLHNTKNVVDNRLMLGAPRFGRKADDGNRPLGLINTVVAYGAGGIRFTGDVPDTTDIDLLIGELTTVSASYTWKHPQCEYVVAESGTAAFTVESDLLHGYVPDAAGTAKAYCGTNTLHLTGDGTGGGIWNRALADGETVAWGNTVAGAPVTLALRKTGTGTWTLPEANTLTGETTLEGGTLDLGAAGTLANSPLVFKGGKLVVAAGRSVTVPSIRTAGGASLIELGAGATLTVTAYNDAGTGTVEVRLGAGACFVNAAAVGGSSTAPLATLRCNGGDVFFDAEGKLTGSCGVLSTTIPVKGGVVPNEPTARVGIVDGGSVEGPVTLAAAETVVTALTHVASADGVVALDGRTLRLGQINLGGTAGNLTIGESFGDGILTPFPDDASKRIDFTVNNPDSTVTVDAQVNGQTARIYKYGSGRVVLNNAADMANIVHVNDGELAFVTNVPARQFTIVLQQSGKLSFLGDPADRRALSLLDADVRAGNDADDEPVLRIENVAGGCVRYDKYLTIGSGINAATPPSVSRVVLKNARFSGSWTNEAPYSPCRVGYGYGSGTLTMDGDSMLGYAPRVGENSRGAFYQLDGLVAYTNATWAGHLWLAPGSYSWGYYALAGGKLDAQGSITIATGAASCGILHQTGGEMVCRNLRNTTNIKGYGLVRHSGGTANYTGYYYAPKSDSSSKELVSALVVDGGDVTAKSLLLLTGPSDNEVHVVLNGGRLTSSAFSISNVSGYGVNGENNHAYLSFDGGVFCPIFSTYTTLSLVNLANAFKRATVYAGGAVFDVAEGHELFVNQELRAPEGRGIAGVVWNGFPGVADDAFLGPPGVRILGDGEGAVAAAVYDRASGRITGVEVLAPGVNYTWAKAEILYAAGSARVGAITNDCTLTAATPAAGFIVKRGAGTLRLTATNTVAGVSLEEGLLSVAVPDALPSPCTVAFKGGRIATVGSATLPPLNLRLVVGETATYPTAFTFPAGSTISIDGLENVRQEVHGYTLANFPNGIANLPPLVDELPPKWQLSKVGSALRLSYMKGTLLIFR